VPIRAVVRREIVSADARAIVIAAERKIEILHDGRLSITASSPLVLLPEVRL
jgi:hypothetical protein